MSARAYTCGSCGTVVSEKEMRLDEMGHHVLNCPECHARIKTKRIVIRPLPDHLMQMPEARFNKRPI